MSAHNNHTTEVEVIPADRNKILKIWKVAGILAFITAIEFAFAFGLDHTFKYTKIFIFIALTVVKAFFIVSEFMHLGHERKSLVYSVILPLLFLVWAITAFLMESDAIFMAISEWYK